MEKVLGVPSGCFRMDASETSGEEVKTSLMRREIRNVAERDFLYWEPFFMPIEELPSDLPEAARQRVYHHRRAAVVGATRKITELLLIVIGRHLKRTTATVRDEHKYPTMKKFITSLLAVIALSSTPLLLTSGCAGTATKESTGEYVDDTALTAKVKTELIRDPVVKARQVDVTTFKGTVQLSGFVDTAEQKDRAAELARAVVGVQDVKNNIVIKASTTP